MKGRPGSMPDGLADVVPTQIERSVPLIRAEFDIRENSLPTSLRNELQEYFLQLLRSNISVGA
jgi:hypothetical protein